MAKIFRDMKGYAKYDKSFICLPRHSSSTMMQGFAKWGRVGHNMAENLGITTVQTTKAHGQNRDKTKCFWKNLSSNELLRG